MTRKFLVTVILLVLSHSVLVPHGTKCQTYSLRHEPVRIRIIGRQHVTSPLRGQTASILESNTPTCPLERYRSKSSYTAPRTSSFGLSHLIHTLIPPTAIDGNIHPRDPLLVQATQISGAQRNPSLPSAHQSNLHHPCRASRQSPKPIGSYPHPTAILERSTLGQWPFHHPFLVRSAFNPNVRSPPGIPRQRSGPTPPNQSHNAPHPHQPISHHKLLKTIPRFETYTPPSHTSLQRPNSHEAPNPRPPHR